MSIADKWRNLLPTKRKDFPIFAAVGNGVIDGESLLQVLRITGLEDAFIKCVKQAERLLGIEEHEDVTIALKDGRLSHVQAALGFIQAHTFVHWLSEHGQDEGIRAMTGNSFGNFLVAMLALGLAPDDAAVACFARGHFQDRSCATFGITDYLHLLSTQLADGETPADVVAVFNKQHQADIPIFGLAISHVDLCALNSRERLDSDVFDFTWRKEKTGKPVKVFNQPPYHHRVIMSWAEGALYSFLTEVMKLPRIETIIAPVWITDGHDLKVITECPHAVLKGVCSEVANPDAWDNKASLLSGSLVSLGLPNPDKPSRPSDPLMLLTGGRRHGLDWKTAVLPILAQ